jgi:hypothetical protein|nr:MAG TPA: hypothetical protein [Caudoviricetes sp.]
MDIKLLRETTAKAVIKKQAENLAHFESCFPKLLAAAKEGHSSFTFEDNNVFPADVRSTGTMDKLKELYPELTFIANDYLRNVLTVIW